MASTYRVTLRREASGWWTANVRSVPGCHTQGRSIDQALNRTREALGLWVDDAAAAKLEPDVRLSRDLRVLVTRAQRARAGAAAAAEAAQSESSAAVHSLLVDGFSTRDAARLLGLSHQRVQQFGDC